MKLRSLSIKWPSRFIWISVRTTDLPFRIMIPFPLGFCEDIVLGLGHLAWLGEKTSPGRRGLERLREVPYLKGLSPSQILYVLRRVLGEIRSLGSFDLVHVETPDGTKVRIRLL